LLVYSSSAHFTADNLITAGTFFKLAGHRSSLIAASKTAIIVGFILNFINQGEALFALEFAHVDYFKFLLTFIVPFLVSVYASTTTKLKFYVGDPAQISGELVCNRCGENKISISRGDIIPECENCKENVRWKLKRVNN